MLPYGGRAGAPLDRPGGLVERGGEGDGSPSRSATGARALELEIRTLRGRPGDSSPKSGYPLLADGELGFQWFPSIEDPELGQRVPQLLCVDQMQTLLADLETRYSIDRAYTLGFSEGAVAAMGTAIVNHEQFAGAVHFGLPEFSPDWLPGQSLPEGKSVRLLFLHGEEDERVPPSVSDETRTFFSDAGYDATLHPFSGGHAVPREQLEVVADWIWQ